MTENAPMYFSLESFVIAPMFVILTTPNVIQPGRVQVKGIWISEGLLNICLFFFSLLIFFILYILPFSSSMGDSAETRLSCSSHIHQLWAP